jgi:MFS family permease
MAPLGLGLMCAYPFIGKLNTRFGARRLATTGSLLALVGMSPLIFLPSHGLNLPLLAIALFVRGLGMSAVGLPALSAGYAATARADIPMATSAMNIVQRLGGPTMTTACATVLGWRLAAGAGPGATAGAFTAAFGLLCALHAAVWAATWRLPKGGTLTPREPDERSETKA